MYCLNTKLTIDSLYFLIWHFHISYTYIIPYSISTYDLIIFALPVWEQEMSSPCFFQTWKHTFASFNLATKYCHVRRENDTDR